MIVLLIDNFIQNLIKCRFLANQMIGPFYGWQDSFNQ